MHRLVSMQHTILEDAHFYFVKARLIFAVAIDAAVDHGPSKEPAIAKCHLDLTMGVTFSVWIAKLGHIAARISKLLRMAKVAHDDGSVTGVQPTVTISHIVHKSEQIKALLDLQGHKM
jgi:hypothetical protein